MLAPVDLHPDDTAARGWLAIRLRGIRVTAGVSQAVLARRLDVDQAHIVRMERRRSWRVRSIQGWARGLDHRLTLELHGLVIPDDNDALAALYDSQTPTSPDEKDLLVLRRLVNDLARVRRAQMSAYHLGQLIGRSESAVLQREENPDGAGLATVQQTARALRGCLAVGVEAVEVSCAAV